MAPHQLVEVIIGNVVNRRGESLDLNYGSIVLGDSNGFPSGSNLKDRYSQARLQSRRGIGYHFQLSTGVLSSDTSNNYDNFICAIDKEGILKLNVPRSSGTGNIMYPASAEFYDDQTGKIKTEYSLNGRGPEPIPITLRDTEFGVVYPPVKETDEEYGEGVLAERYSGVRFSNDNNYFKGFSGNSGDDDNGIRVNVTKHHNMYAAAEMLIANTIDSINIPFQNAICTGLIPGNPVGKSFERAKREKNGAVSGVNYMSTVSVDPRPPAINHGGGGFVAGKDYALDTDTADKRQNYQFSNEFSSSPQSERENPGGKSANLNFDGSIELSVGKDETDQKSILLDTAGSMVAWFGKDANDRSLVVQTDGAALLNVGGHNGQEFNKGQLDIRVNVTDKGFVGLNGDQSSNSDYIISISEKGIVIAGMAGTPMVIRNNSNLSIESSAKLILSANQIELREGNMPSKGTDASDVSSDTPDAASIESVQSQITCLSDALKALSE